MSLLIRNGLLLDPGLDTALPKKRDILIEDRHITEIQEDLSYHLDTNERRLPTMEAEGKLVIPGLINSHLHSHDHFDRGRFDNLPLELWILFIRPWIEAKPLSPRELYLRTIVGAMEMVRTGTTFAIDDVNLTPFNTLENVDAVMRAYRDIGMRALVSISIFDKPVYQTVPFVESLIPKDIRSAMDQASNFTLEDWTHFLRDCLETWKGPGELTRFILGPSAPQRCTDRLLLRVKELSEEFDRNILTHTLETKVQRVTGEMFYGKSIIAHLDELGLLGRNTSLVHCVWVSAEDIDLIAEAGSSVIHCPISNLKLGSGIAPLEKMLRKKIGIGLGTDNTSCNDSQNMFEVMKFAALLPKIQHGTFSSWPTAMEIFRAATTGGAQIAKMKGEVGTLSLGSKADLTVLDLNGPSFLPVGKMEQNLVYSENGRSVDKVIVNGEVIFENRKLVRINEIDLSLEIRETAERLRKEHRSVFEKAEEIYPYFKQAYLSCQKEFERLSYTRP